MPQMCCPLHASPLLWRSITQPTAPATGLQICEGTVTAIHPTFTELRPQGKMGGRLIVNNAGVLDV